jgi:hypothetical protein
MDFKIGDVVQVTNKYPSDKDYPYAHTDDIQLWGLHGTVVASEFGYTDDKYVFVQPLTSPFADDWPRKKQFDPLPYWHFTPEELRKVR